MALVKPIINEIVAFDANVGSYITFSASGGDQVVANEIKVTVNSEEQGEIVVYRNKTTSYNLSHTIPPYVLTNGLYYKVTVRTFDVLDNSSEWSNYQPFYCYTTPTITLNIRNNQTITTHNYNVTAIYRQAEGEKIEYAIIQLYNEQGVLIESSGNIYNSTSPPLTFNYFISGMNNNARYTISVTAVTVNGTVVNSKAIFRTDYGTITSTGVLNATVDTCNGYINLKSSMLTNLIGMSHPDPATYINRAQIDLISTVGDIDNERYSSWAKWSEGLIIPSDFLLRVWFYPARQPFKVIELSDGDNGLESLTINYQRGSLTDYLSIRTTSGTVIDKNLGTHCNGNTKVFLWLCISGSTWTVQTEILDTLATVIEWNNTPVNTLKYNVTSDVTYAGESYGTFTPSSPIYYPLADNLFVLKFGNGIFDELDITTDVTIPYTTDIPTYDGTTILSLSFKGNLDNNIPHYDRAVLKRKESEAFTWIDLQEVNITEPNVPYYIDYNDSFIPTGVKQIYALVTYIGGAESEYYTVEVTPQWGRVFISDKTTKFGLNYGVIYTNHNQNIQNGVLMPIGAQYPIVIQNANGNYRSGSLQFKVLGYQFEIDKRLDRPSIVQQTNDILAFLTNGKAKCIVDYNGNIFVVKVINSPQISFDANWGNGIATISFDWVEQCKYDDYESMEELGLIDRFFATE